jgi:hypothetical protein
MSDQFENDGPYQDAVSAEEIERRIMDSAFPKTSMEWWAHREIKELRDRLSDLEAALKNWDALIRHQYTGSREAMSDMTVCAQETAKLLYGPAPWPSVNARAALEGGKDE